ncbi:MAG: prepilin-type N-terminal cleavage/methylation domain-containing protein [Armatimonadetes bacterium]|nr:prepilin-type N-terminal cleavage/methylation domain-containing protein [Armatimonadota bacterium]
MKVVKDARFGFTLIELLVVIAIIAILAAILFPVFSAYFVYANISCTSSNANYCCIQDTVTGVYYAVAKKARFFSSFGTQNYDPPHQKGSNYVFADGHAKWLRYEATFSGSFDFDPSSVAYGATCIGTGVVNWTMWDRRKSP